MEIEKNQQNIGPDEPVFSWKAKEFALYQKSAGWFAVIILAALVLAAYFVWVKSWTAAGVVAAGLFALFSTSGLLPKKIECAIYKSGVVIDGKAHRFTDLKSFWVVYGDHPEVRFQRPGFMAQSIHLPLAEEDPEQIRLFLIKFLPEDQNRGEDLTDTISRWIKF